MFNLKSPGIKEKILSICVVVMLCMPILLMAQGGKGKDKSGRCYTITVDAVFDDASTNGIQSDGYDYIGLQNAATVCILRGQDYDFILGTMNYRLDMRYAGFDRKVTLDFEANNTNLNLPFEPFQIVDASIRVDLVLEAPVETRFIMWFEVEGSKYRNYKLYFDGQLGASSVQVTVDGDEPNRKWTIESINGHKARLEYGRGKDYIEQIFLMPFKITVDETSKPPTCL